ncbi:MAG TPA: preprotein translocase subunit YajC [Blastocatellia bacterium]|nr:preprotein translocase subunit YajC [Blastocatellia bacterium]
MTSPFLLFQAGGGIIGAMAPFILILGVFYFLLIMPQRKRQKQLQDMVSALKTGDRIVTNSGIIGTITSIKDDSLMLRTGSVNIEVQRSSVASMQSDAKDTKDVKGSLK